MSDKLKNFLLWAGAITAAISALTYIVITAVMVFGFEQRLDANKRLLFTILGAVDGFLISVALRTQGVQLAANKPESKTVMKKYRDLLNKNKPLKKLHTIEHFMIISMFKDALIKALTVAASTYLVLYVFLEGNGDISLLLLALANILIFTGFGMMNMAKAYDYYLDEHISAIEAKIAILSIAGPIVDEHKEDGLL